MKRPISAELGLSLVELMVAILLASMLTAGMFYLLSGQQRGYTEQIQNTNTQLNLSGAMQLLQREVQRAGYGFPGCPSGIPAQSGVLRGWNGAVGTVPLAAALAVFNNCNLLLTNPGNCPDNSGVDSLEITYQNEEPARGSLASLRTTLARAAHFSVETVVGDAFYTPVRNIGNFQLRDLVVMWDVLSASKDCVLLEVTGTDVGRLLHTAAGTFSTRSGGSRNNLNPTNGFNAAAIFPAGGYPTGSSAVRLGPNSTPHFFAVDTRTEPPRLVTWRSWNANPSADATAPEVIADGIEDMQISWACDANASNTLEEDTRRTDDEWGNNVPGDAPPACGIRNVDAVRITLIGRGSTPITGDQNATLGTGRPAAEDHLAGTAAEDKARNGLGPYPRTTLRTTMETLNLQ